MEQDKVLIDPDLWSENLIWLPVARHSLSQQAGQGHWLKKGQRGKQGQKKLVNLTNFHWSTTWSLRLLYCFHYNANQGLYIWWTTPAKFRVCLRFCALGLSTLCIRTGQRAFTPMPMHKAHPEVGGCGPPYLHSPRTTGITRRQLSVSYSKLEEILRNSHGLYRWATSLLLNMLRLKHARAIKMPISSYFKTACQKWAVQPPMRFTIYNGKKHPKA